MLHIPTAQAQARLKRILIAAITIPTALKTLAAMVVGIILFIGFTGFVAMMVSGFDATEKAELINWYEESYVARRYDELKEQLELHNLHDEDFSLYWEAVESYELRCLCIQWNMAAQQGVEGVEENAVLCLSRLEAMAEEPQFSRNAGLLEGFWEDAQ